MSEYRVNGEPQSTGEDCLTVEQILVAAGNAASVYIEDLHRYYLEDVSGERKWMNLSDKVAISDGDRFLAVYAGKTPVAAGDA